MRARFSWESGCLKSSLCSGISSELPEYQTLGVSDLLCAFYQIEGPEPPVRPVWGSLGGRLTDISPILARQEDADKDTCGLTYNVPKL